MPSAQFDTTVSFTISYFGSISGGNVPGMFLSNALLQLDGSICAAGLYALDSATDSEGTEVLSLRASQCSQPERANDPEAPLQAAPVASMRV